MNHSESHRTHHTGWLRAAVLSANAGIVSPASLIVGVAAAETSRSSVLVTGVIIVTHDQRTLDVFDRFMKWKVEN